MASLPIKPEYGPTLGELLSPWWRAASRLARGTVLAAVAVLVLGAVALLATLLDSGYSHGGPVPFSFKYRGLYSTTPERGGYVRVEQRDHEGALLYSFAVGPVELPSYSGLPFVELPLYANAYVAQLQRTVPGFVMRGEGKARVNQMPAYNVLYTTVVEGREMYGRNVLLVPESPGMRDGLVIAMLTAPGANHQIKGPYEVASTGVLVRPLHSFEIG